MRESPALVGLDRMDPAKTVGSEKRAGPVRPAMKDQPPAVGRQFRLPLDKVRLFHPDKRRDAFDLFIGDAHDPVFDPAARPALAAHETHSL